MLVNTVEYATQNRVFSKTGSIGGIHLPDFDDIHIYSKKKTGTSESEYTKQIIEQARKDQAAGVFQTESKGFNTLAKKYVSEVSPDRKGIITQGLKKVAMNQKDVSKPIDFITLILTGKLIYQNSGISGPYAEFYDSNGEKVAKYSNGGWTMLNTKAETQRQIQMCSIYNKAWSEAAKEEKSIGSLSFSIIAENTEYTFDRKI